MQNNLENKTCNINSKTDKKQAITLHWIPKATSKESKKKYKSLNLEKRFKRDLT